VPGLIIKKDIRTKRAKKITLIHTSQEKCLIYTDIPGP
jgi:hypothetical protein